MAEKGAVKMNGGFELRAKSVVAWNPETKEITPGPAKGQQAENEQEAIAKHKAASAAGE